MIMDTHLTRSKVNQLGIFQDNQRIKDKAFVTLFVVFSNFLLVFRPKLFSSLCHASGTEPDVHRGLPVQQ